MRYDTTHRQWGVAGLMLAAGVRQGDREPRLCLTAELIGAFLLGPAADVPSKGRLARPHVAVDVVRRAWLRLVADVHCGGRGSRFSETVGSVGRAWVRLGVGVRCERQLRFIRDPKTINQQPVTLNARCTPTGGVV